MFPIGAFSRYLVRSLAEVFASSLFWAVLALVFWQNTRLERLEQRFCGTVAYPAWRRTLNALLYGLAGGAAASFLLVFLGVSLSGLGISYVWLLALLLMLVNQRFMCFAYAGGIVGLVSLVLAAPKIDIPGLMGLVAVLHLAESLLIRLNGHYAAVPVFLRDKGGAAVGGFSLQRFWPLPLVALLLLAVPEAAQLGESLQLPDWWPLLREPPGLPAGTNYVYYLFPLTAVLGYGDMAVTSEPRAKARFSAIILGWYSLGLLTLALLSSRFPPLRWLAVLYAPLGHEWVIHLGRLREAHGQPRYSSPPEGVKLLAVLPGSPAQRAGWAAGDVLLAVGETVLTGRADLVRVLAEPQSHWRFQRRRPDGGIISQSIPAVASGFPSLGVVTVPDGSERYYVIPGGRGVLGGWWAKLRCRLGKRS